MIGLLKVLLNAVNVPSPPGLTNDIIARSTEPDQRQEANFETITLSGAKHVHT